jgi:hypothetical protein
LLVGLVVSGILGLLSIAIGEIRMRRLPELEAAGEVYRRMRHYGLRLAVVSEPGDTPYEFAASLGSRLQELSSYVKDIHILLRIFQKMFITSPIGSCRPATVLPLFTTK